MTEEYEVLLTLEREKELEVTLNWLEQHNKEKEQQDIICSNILDMWNKGYHSVSLLSTIMGIPQCDIRRFLLKLKKDYPDITNEIIFANTTRHYIVVE